MNLRTIILILHLTSTIGYLPAQNERKGSLIISLSAGGSFSNFLNSEAPHKIFAPGFGQLVFPNINIENYAWYTDYEVGLFKDILAGIALELNVEYFIKEDLSLLTGLGYESKGINLNYSNSRQGTVILGGSHSGQINESLKKKISNNYLLLPILLRKYISRHKIFYLEGGLYSGYLLSSNVKISNFKIVNEGPIFSSSSKFDEKEYTNTMDYGFSIGGGFVKNLSHKVVFSINMRMNFGMRKVDSKFDNEFELSSFPSGGPSVISTNYFGLNSDSKNINAILAFGIGHKAN